MSANQIYHYQSVYWFSPVTIFGYVLTATSDLLASRAKLRGGHVVLLEEAMHLLNQSELRKFIII